MFCHQSWQVNRIGCPPQIAFCESPPQAAFQNTTTWQHRVQIYTFGNRTCGLLDRLPWLRTSKLKWWASDVKWARARMATPHIRQRFCSHGPQMHGTSSLKSPSIFMPSLTVINGLKPTSLKTSG